MKPSTQIYLHKLAIEALTEIEKCNQSIIDCQNNSVDIYKNPYMTKIVKDALLDGYTDTINSFRKSKKQFVEKYAEILRKMIEPVIDHSEVVSLEIAY